MTHKDEIEKGAQCGMDEFLTKPPKFELLKDVIERRFNGCRRGPN
jgi:hypothetical protein